MEFRNPQNNEIRTISTLIDALLQTTAGTMPQAAPDERHSRLSLPLQARVGDFEALERIVPSALFQNQVVS
jgi:hypothetical protein